MTPHDDTADMYEPPAPDKLYRHHRQQLSAMLDGELEPDQGRFMLRRLEHDRDLAECWERWQVLGDVMRGRGGALLPSDFAQRVQAALVSDAEVDAVAAPAVAAAAGTHGARWLRWGGGAALAASVAAIALMVGRPSIESPAAAGAQVAIGDAAPATPVDGGASTAGAGAPVDPLAAGATALAAVAVAAEAPRRGERRERANHDRAVARVATRRPASQAEAAAASPAPSATSAVLVAAETVSPSAARDPFAAPASPAARPWPRAILPELAPATAVTARYGTSEAFHPFQPRLAAVPVAASTDAVDAPAEAATP